MGNQPPVLLGRSFLRVDDFTAAEYRYLLDYARELKRAREEGREVPRLQGKCVCLIFEKTSTRTRCAFEVACHHQGAGVTYLDPANSQIGHKESIRDTARVLARFFDAVEYRGFRQEAVEELARYAGIPVYNGLTDDWHPTQVLADLMTMEEHLRKPLQEIRFAFLGDTRNNVAVSLLTAGTLLGMDVRLVGPRELFPASERLELARVLAEASGARWVVTEEIPSGVKGVDFLYTDVWVSLGEPPELWAERIQLLKPYRVDASCFEATGNPEVRLLHCLPAFHDEETRVGREVAERFGLRGGLEVSDEVFESPANLAFVQAENRLHTIKALLLATLVG
jgi:ornithine carbamoyltransferase